jgi:uncharacterized membrane protein YcaP (DUF421 family)
MRWLGKRMAGELTITERVLVVTLGASVAVAIQVPEGGVLLGFVVLTCALFFEYGISLLTVKSRRFEKISQGHSDMLVKDGVLLLEKMKDTRITKQQIFATLRVKEISQLGEVERLYLEAGTGFSIYKVAGEPPPGLSVFPADDQEVAGDQCAHIFACTNCGNTYRAPPEGACDKCHLKEFTNAVH